METRPWTTGGAAIYDLCIAMYKQRKKLTGTGGWGR